MSYLASMGTEREREQSREVLCVCARSRVHARVHACMTAKAGSLPPLYLGRVSFSTTDVPKTSEVTDLLLPFGCEGTFCLPDAVWILFALAHIASPRLPPASYQGTWEMGRSPVSNHFKSQMFPIFPALVIWVKYRGFIILKCYSFKHGLMWSKRKAGSLGKGINDTRK